MRDYSGTIALLRGCLLLPECSVLQAHILDVLPKLAERRARHYIKGAHGYFMGSWSDGNGGGHGGAKASEKALDKYGKSDIIRLEDYYIGRSLSAKAKNYDVFDPSTNETFHFVEGTKIQNREVFAGYGTKHRLHDGVAEGLSKVYEESDVNKWQHAKGIGVLDYHGEERKAEVHWFQEETVGKVKFKVKEWLE